MVYRLADSFCSGVWHYMKTARLSPVFRSEPNNSSCGAWTGDRPGES